MFRFKIRNLTPHDVQVTAKDGTMVVFPPDPAGPARVGEEWLTYPQPLRILCPDGETREFTLASPRYSDVEGLPEVDEDTKLLVSKMVADAVIAANDNRTDLIGVGKTIRDAKGRIIGALSFADFS